MVHYGWGASRTQVWVPASWFRFQIRMSVDHTHTFTDTGFNRNNTHRELICNTCGFRTVDSLYNLSGSIITGIRYPLLGSVTIPNLINIYSTAFASFTYQSITTIGNSAFSNSQLSKIIIPESVVSIGSNAFAGCNNLTIYTDWDSPLPGWATNWNPLNRPVVWGTQHAWRNFVQISLNTLYHRASCACGVTQMQYHRYQQLSWNKVVCIDCGFECDPNTSILPPLFTLSPKPNINVE